MCLGGGGGGAYLALVWFLPGVHQEVFLQVGQLGEVLGARLTPERALTAVHAQMNLPWSHQSVSNVTSPGCYNC